ncbi:hypothetical protein SAMN04487968_10913 [Nocardioides terrae]|uniref:Uncharacterized protein n=1 Tax=Nocardioides terrae TaxID=574651 RepID=A0A1I1KZT3_9ACTN|nr:hypothetical protein [Nocardioides terrae]SFC64248.1 hypothetical protein SAMN04487968_10913 [Nocardioides terrae]
MSALTASETVQIQVGNVTVSGPGSKGCYRLTWLNPDGSEGDTTGGRDLDGDIAKAEGIDSWVSSAAGPKAFATLESMMEDCLEQGRSPYDDKKPWKPQNRTQIERHLSRQLRGFETYRGLDVNRELVDKMRAQAGTEVMVKENTIVLRSFLLWGYQAGYLTALQGELLPRACSMPAPSIRRTVVRISEDEGDERARMNGQEETYIRDEDAPSRTLVSALSRTVATYYPLWGELAPELAANSGARWGEQFQLTA